MWFLSFPRNFMIVGAEVDFLFHLFWLADGLPAYIWRSDASRGAKTGHGSCFDTPNGYTAYVIYCWVLFCNMHGWICLRCSRRIWKFAKAVVELVLNSSPHWLVVGCFLTILFQVLTLASILWMCLFGRGWHRGRWAADDIVIIHHSRRLAPRF